MICFRDKSLTYLVQALKTYDRKDKSFLEQPNYPYLGPLIGLEPILWSIKSNDQWSVPGKLYIYTW